MDFNRLIVTTDLSEPSTVVFDLAAHEAKMKGTKLHLIYVLELVQAPYYGDAMGSGAFVSDWLEESKQAAEDKLKVYVDNHFHGCDVKTTVLTATTSVGKEIVDYASACSADGILIASGGRGYLGKLVLGSTVQRVLQHADCPVVVIPPEPKEKK